MNIWEFNRKVSNRLLTINIINVMIGNRLSKENGFWSGVGSQAIGWGVINIGIAVIGSFVTRRRLDKLENPYDDQIMAKETRNLRNLLLINTVLDVFYMLGGRAFADRFGKKDDVKRGHGWGIVIQGGLLFFFDLIHAGLLLRK